ncbi:hypothetical protein JQ597_13180 [Bradyrhizobium sp. AUGA SZCCT0177]|uniref:hypothetical protein n=1 Tax=Bradyrhizobium sp. AUGA SZCCT0177 TaxID=2807665 RepID=UPI001BA9471F|nr:hypothetical protein [Bradyrhizobium sp. AUGA SZCCT0177]MBR1282994.1 hypothetical protein [Bradyrhizobium sp. AUGA SZCCT0177]
MSTDKLQVLHNTVAEILSEPPSPPTFFDEEPHDAARASEQVAKASDNLRRGIETPIEHFGKAPSREPGISIKKIHDAPVARDARNEIPGIARQALAEQVPGAAPSDAGNQLASRLSHEVPSPRSDPQTKSFNTFRPAVSDNRISLGGWALRGIAGVLLAAGIGAGLATWLGSPGDAAKTAPSQPAPLAQAAPTAAALPPELTPLLQSMARDLASMGKEIEQLKAGRDLMARDNAKLNEQFRASQEQLTRAVAQLSEQLKASQEQAARDNASVAGQIKGIQEQLASVISRAPEQNASPRIAATPPRPTPPSPRPAAPGVRQPVPTLSSPQATTQPRAERPKPSPTSRPPAPAQ